MIVASIAYEQLPPAAQQQTLAILQAHPMMTKWKEQLEKDKPTDSGAYFFMRASTWPDEIRRGNSPYDHPSWHYIDYPLTPPNFPFVAGLEPENNILFGIKDCEKVLRDPASNPEQRAASLSWLIHLIGDLHQPLHCAELVTPQYPLPDGRPGRQLGLRVGRRKSHQSARVLGPPARHDFQPALCGGVGGPDRAHLPGGGAT